jgi:hypothetical protein
MPINLLANIDLRTGAGVPGLDRALSEAAQNPTDVRTVAATLLRYNQCPDFIEDQGHRFGSWLGDDEKRALIEYLKKF